MKEARYYRKLENGKVKCLLCPQECLIAKGKVGICRARLNQDGILYALTYGKCTSYALDPIEKKPLYHFYPGSVIFSFGPNGCNFACPFCQNWTISQEVAPTIALSSEQAVRLAERNGSVGIAYTYAEPLIWFEYILDTSKLAQKVGLKNVLVTNGFVNEESLRELLPYIDAMNIDVKSIKESFYREICKGKLAPVLHTVEIAYKEGCHIELTNLVIPTLNDTEEEFKELTDWVASLGREIPLHFSRYYPCYQMTTPATPVSTLKKAREIAQMKLKYVYLGNVLDEESNSTYCPNCKKAIIVRSGYLLSAYRIKEGNCTYCGAKIDVID